MKNYVKPGQRLPLYGVGPHIVLAMAACTALGIILFSYVFRVGILSGPWIPVFRTAGILLILCGLIIWVIGMFATSIYLIGVEFIDSSLAKTLEEVTEREAGWDMLIPDSETVVGRVQGKIDDTRTEVKDRINERQQEVKGIINEKRGELEGLIQQGNKTVASIKNDPDESGSEPEREDEA